MTDDSPHCRECGTPLDDDWSKRTGTCAYCKALACSQEELRETMDDPPPEQVEDEPEEPDHA